MPLYPFGPNDIFYNRVKTYPKVDFWIYDTKVYHNNRPVVAGMNHSQSLHIPPGHVSLYELNVDRDQNSAGQMIYPFITKDSGISAFKTVSQKSFNSGYLYGETITGEYPLSSSLAFDMYSAGVDDVAAGVVGRRHSYALKNTLNHYKFLSPHYEYSSSLGNKGVDNLKLISIPSIFFGSSIDRGTVNLKYYITGTLVAELQDIYKNGELVQVSGSATGLGADYGSGNVAGVVLYNEGFVLLTGSWNLDPEHKDYYTTGASLSLPKWINFGSCVGESQTSAQSVTSSAWNLSFNAINYVPTVTMLAHAPAGMFNHSNNPTYKKYISSAADAMSSSYRYMEDENLEIKNTVSSSWIVITSSSDENVVAASGSFKKQTYISKIGIYDEKKNLIAIAKLAKPVRKDEQDDFSFKMKIDF